MEDIISGIIYSFADLFIILDPILSVPVFTTMTKGLAPGRDPQTGIHCSCCGGGANVPVSHFQQNDF